MTEQVAAAHDKDGHEVDGHDEDGHEVDGHDDDGYTGPAELVAGEVTVAVHVQLAGHFDPISGHYSWYGRLNVSPEVDALVASGAQKVELCTPGHQVATRLSDVDPWGRYRVEGFGNPPFDVATDLPESGSD